MKPPDEVLRQVADLKPIRDRIRQELAFRKTTGRRYHPDFLDVDDDDLAGPEGLVWYEHKIHTLLKPYDHD